jgi:hypothetical protein
MEKLTTYLSKQAEDDVVCAYLSDSELSVTCMTSASYLSNFFIVYTVYNHALITSLYWA